MTCCCGRNRGVHVYAKDSTPAIKEIIRHIEAEINNRYGIPLRMVESGEELIDDDPILVICYNHSRIGTDIDYATSAFKVSNKKLVAVVVVHVIARHAFPSILPTDNLGQYGQYGLLVDYFLNPEEQTLYSCDFNETAKKKLNTFILQNNIEVRTTVLWVKYHKVFLLLLAVSACCGLLVMFFLLALDIEIFSL